MNDLIWGPFEERDILETGRSQVYLISLLRTEVTPSIDSCYIECDQTLRAKPCNRI